MNKLALKLDCWINNELKNYLIGLNGITRVDIDKKQDIITISYDFDSISIYVIKKEIELFLEIQNMPSIVSFDKYFEDETKFYEINIKDLCCEYCLKGNIEELLMIDGIEKVSSDFDNVNKKDVKISLNYNDKLISIDKIIELENKFNYNK